MGYSMRTPRYRYTEWRNFRTGDVEALELYDHSEDPLEMINLAGHAPHGETVDKLSERLGLILETPEKNP